MSLFVGNDFHDLVNDEDSKLKALDELTFAHHCIQGERKAFDYLNLPVLPSLRILPRARLMLYALHPCARNSTMILPKSRHCGIGRLLDEVAEVITNAFSL